MNDFSRRRHLAKILRRAPKLVYLGARVYRVFQPKYSIGVVGVLFNQAGQVLLVEHVFHPKNPWGLPGGWLAKHENPAQTVVRELQEELELEIEIGPLVLAEVSYPGHMDMAYLCSARNEIGNLNAELLDYRWCDPHELPGVQRFHRRAISRALEFLEEKMQV